MNLESILTIIAIILGPVAAIGIGHLLTSCKQEKDRRFWVFATLMATRSAKLHPDHVQALNGIDVAFYKQSDTILAWKSYQEQFSVSTDEWQKNVARRDALFDDMLQKMGRALGYDFDIKNIKTPSYTPQGYENAEMDNRAAQQMWLEILANKRAFPIRDVSHLVEEQDVDQPLEKP